MIKLFNETDTTYSSNGDVVLNPTYAVVHKEDNGDYYLDLETNLTNETKTIPSETGTNVAINGSTQITADGNKEVEIIDIKGNTQQSGTPTPSSPQPINVVTGEQNIHIVGRNLLTKSGLSTPTTDTGFWFQTDYVTPLENGWCRYQATNTSSSRMYVNTFTKPKALDIEPSTQYTIVVEFRNINTIGTSNNKLTLCQNRNDEVFTNSMDVTISGTQKAVSTTKRNINTTTGLRVFYRLYPNESVDFEARISVIKGNYSIDNFQYEAYNDNTYEINLGKNLFDKDNANVINAYFDEQTTAITSNASNRVIYIACEPSTTYTLTKFKSSYKRSIAYTKTIPSVGTQTYGQVVIPSNRTTGTITTGSDAQYLVLRLTNTNQDSSYTIQQMLDSIQIEKGSQATEYASYFEPIELCKIGNYQDKIYKDNGKWYLHKEVRKVVVNSSAVEGSSNYPTIKNIDILKQDYPSQNTPLFKDLTTYITNISGISTNNSAIGLNTTGTSGSIILNKSYFGLTMEQWNTNYPSLEIFLYYGLKTPENTEIEDTDLIEQLESIRLFNGINNISITSNNLTGLIDLHYDFVTGGEVSINDYITSNKILVANTPTGDQAFRITNIDKTRSKIKLIAKHITYDSENYVIQDSYVVDKTCNQALDHLNNATDNPSPFTMTSDITTINSYRCVRKSLWEAIEVVLERWGGHITRNNWSIGVMSSIGTDNGVVVRYAKNLKNINVNYDWNDVVTKILPVGQDGLLLDEIYLFADIQYDIPYTKVVHFSQDVDEEQYKDENGQLDEDAYQEALKADLRQQARNYLQVNYLPKVNYELNANLEKITDIGDTIEVIDERLGINLQTNLIAYDYDCILERYKTLEFGNFRKNLTDLTTYIDTQTTQIVEDNIETTKVTLENELQTATSQLWGVLGSSYVLIEGDKILIVDSLPKETAHNVIMLNSAGIGFSQTGINGTFSTALTIDGTFNTSNVNVINFTADLIKGGELKLGSNLNQNGILEVYDEANNLIAQLDKNGLRMNAVNGAYVLINQQVGFAGYDRNDNPIYWVSEDEFHMKKSVVEEEITLVDKMRIIPITITDNGTIVNDGIGFVSTL